MSDSEKVIPLRKPEPPLDELARRAEADAVGRHMNLLSLKYAIRAQECGQNYFCIALVGMPLQEREQLDGELRALFRSCMEMANHIRKLYSAVPLDVIEPDQNVVVLRSKEAVDL